MTQVRTMKQTARDLKISMKKLRNLCERWNIEIDTLHPRCAAIDADRFEEIRSSLSVELEMQRTKINEHLRYVRAAERKACE